MIILLFDFVDGGEGVDYSTYLKESERIMDRILSHPSVKAIRQNRLRSNWKELCLEVWVKPFHKHKFLKSEVVQTALTETYYLVGSNWRWLNGNN